MLTTIFNRTKRSFAVLLLATSCLVSCKRFLEVPAAPPNKIEQSQLFADSTTAMTAVASVYSYPSYIAGNFTFNDAAIAIYPGLSADELTPGGNEANAVQFYNNALLADNYYSGVLWNGPYAGLYAVNAIISSVSASPGLSESFKKQITAEMKVMRALYYFYLVNEFGAVPLVTSIEYKATSILPRASADSIYDQILADLNDARQALPPTYPSAGRARPNLYTAMALLARVQLYRQNWQAAYDAVNTVINSKMYSLEKDLNKVFLTGSTEAIWQLPANYNNNNFQVSEAGRFIPYSSNVIPSFPIAATLFNAFESGDQRVVKWIASSTVTVGAATYIYRYPYKYKNTQYSNPTVEDYMIFRLGEQYLIRAEAAAHLNNMATAVADLDTVRVRAGLLPTMVSPASQSDVLKAIMHERQTELFTEWGHRWFDLKRTGTAGAVLGAVKPSWKPEAALYPVPNAQRQLNYRLTQNPGYN